MSTEAAAATEKKDLSFYINNPDALGDMSDDEIEALAQQGESSGDQAADTEKMGDTESAAAPGDTAGTEKKDDQQQPEPGKQPDETPEGILARDGKHIIPYKRLEDAEARARDQARKIEELQAQINGKQATDDGGDKDAGQQDDFLSDEELDELERDFPAMAKVIRAQQVQIRQLGGQVDTLSKAHKSQEEVQTRDAQASWNDALAKNAKAAYLDQTLNPEVGQRFVNATAGLYENWNEMSADDRAAAIVRQYEAVHGEIQVKQVAGSKEDKPTSPAKTPGNKPDVPLSMADIPGGSAPPVDEVAALASKSGQELLAQFEKMSPEQIEAQLNRI